MAAQFIGVGVGPGDPELITLKAARYIHEADVISFIANEAGRSQAKHIAREVLAQCEREKQEIALVMPMSEDRRQANTVYDEAAHRIEHCLKKGLRVIFLCEGDPLFFASFAYLLERMQPRVKCQVVPGISSMHAAAAVLQHPLAILDESFVVVSGRHTDADLLRALDHHDSVVIMKAGRARQRILDVLQTSGRAHEARYLEYIGRDKQRVETNVLTLADEPGPYFSLFVVTRR